MDTSGRPGVDLIEADRDDGPPPATPSRSRRSRLAALVVDHPVLTVALAGLLFIAFQTWWNLSHRHLGAFNVDEEGGLAAALRFHRAVGLNPRPLLQEVFGTWNGPLVPLLSVPIVMIGPTTVSSVMVVQSVLVVAAACGTAGAVLAIANRRAALLAGLTMLLLPVSVVASRSYQYSIGVAAFMALALWALLASDRGRDRWRMVGFGASIGAMVLCRTMAAAFVPGLGLAALVVLDRSRRSWTNLVVAAASAFAVAGPWWLVQWDNIFAYLRENAYGDRAHYWGSVAFGDRVRDQTEFFGNDFRLLVVIGAVAFALAFLLLVGRRLRHASPSWEGSRRLLVALLVAAVLGRAALLSTSNLGFWFAHPLDVTIIAASVAFIAGVPRGDQAILRRWKPVLGGATVVFLLVSFSVSLGLEAGGKLPEDDWRWAFVSDHAALQGGNLEADPRLASDDADVRRAAADEWWHASVELAKAVDRLDDRHPSLLQTVVGEIHLLNLNTIGLAEEVTGYGRHALQVVNTLEPPDERLRADLTPTLNGIPRVIIDVRGRSLGFPNGRGRARYIRLAEDEGWIAGASVPLPDGGTVVVFTHPDSIPQP